MGLASGLALVHPVSALLGPTTITWDASSCPAGIYMITSLARGGNQTYSVTTSNVTLPKGAVVQQFSDLPAGTYQVSATATGNNGRSFNSQVQTIQGGSSGGIIFGRSRPPTSPATGLARSRNQPPPVDKPRPPNDPRLTPAADATPAPPVNTARASGMLDDDLRRLLVLLAEDSSGMDGQWRRIDVVDDDADGRVDYVAVESTSGEVRVYRVRGSL